MPARFGRGKIEGTSAFWSYFVSTGQPSSSSLFLTSSKLKKLKRRGETTVRLFSERKHYVYRLAPICRTLLQLLSTEKAPAFSVHASVALIFWSISKIVVLHFKELAGRWTLFGSFSLIHLPLGPPAERATRGTQPSLSFDIYAFVPLPSHQCSKFDFEQNR